MTLATRPTQTTATQQRAVFYRQAVHDFLRNRLPANVDLERATDDVLRDVWDAEVLRLFDRTFRDFEERLLLVTVLKLRQLLPPDPTRLDADLPARLWPIPPASEEQREAFEGLYAVSFLSYAAQTVPTLPRRGKEDVRRHLVMTMRVVCGSEQEAVAELGRLVEAVLRRRRAAAPA